MRGSRVRPLGADEGYPYGELISPAINVADLPAVRITFKYYREVECYTQGSYDRTYVQVSFDNGPWQTVWQLDSTDCWEMKQWMSPEPWGPGEGEGWIKVAVPADASTMRIKFVFDAVDNVANYFLGWLIDDVKVAEAGPEALRIEPDSLPEGIVEQEYRATLTAVGGTPPYTWRVISKPDWLTVNTLGAMVSLSGTPEESDTYQLCIGVSDSRGQTYEHCYDIVIEQAIGVLFYDDFENDLCWTTSGLWHRTDGSAWPQYVWPRPEPPYASPTHCFYYGRDETLNYATGGPNSGELISPQIDVSELTAGTQLTIGWKYWREVEFYAGEYDKTYVQIKFDTDSDWTTIWYEDSSNESEEGWQLVEKSAYTDGDPILVPAGATTLQIKFVFDTVDGYANDHVGWLIDDVKVVQQVAGPPPLEIITECPLPDGTEGQAYGPVYLEASGGTGGYEWAATGLPEGLSCSTDGAIFGTPAAGTAGTYQVTIQVTDSAGNIASKICNLTINSAPSCPCELLTGDFTDPAGWTMTGLWHVTNEDNLPEGCEIAGCDKLEGDFAYFGQDDTCNYNTGTTVVGYLTSPEIDVPECVEEIVIGFDYFRHVESYGGNFDRTFVQISWDGGPWQTIWTKSSNDPSPECASVVIGPIDVPEGAANLQLRFGFNSVDPLYNNFPGWAVDNVWVKNAACVEGAGPMAAPMAEEPKAAPRKPVFMVVPNPVKDVHTASFTVRGVDADLIRVEIYDLAGRLVWKGEAPGNELIWHTEDLSGQYLANGVYFYVIYVKVGNTWIQSDIRKLAIYR